MFRKSTLLSFFTFALMLAFATAAAAQTAPVRGRVEMKDAEGKLVPVANAVIDCYRVDINGKFPSSKTDKKGVFTFAGLPLGATFVLAISAPGTTPSIQPNVKAGMEEVVVVVVAGDGKALTEAEVRDSLKKGVTPAGGGGGQAEMSAEQKKAQEEYEKKVAEVNAKNEKIKKATEIINNAIKDGAAAYAAKNFDLAVAKYREGYEADPDFVGSAPAMLNNMSVVLITRAGDHYNKNANVSQEAKAEAREYVKRDMTEVIKNSDAALKIIESAEAPTDEQAKKNMDSNRLIAKQNKAKAYRMMSQTVAEITKGKEAKIAFDEYLALETDPARKTRAQMDLANTLKDSQEFALAVEEYQKILGVDPNNAEALYGIGVSMVTLGYTTMTGDGTVPADEAKGKSQLQDAANFLQRYVDSPTADAKLIEEVKAAIGELKAVNVAPQKGGGKTTTTTRKKP